MKKWIFTICSLVLMGCVAQPALSGGFVKAHQGGISNRYLVVLAPSALDLAEGPVFASGAAKTQRLADEISLRFRIRPVAVYGQVGQFLIQAPERVALRVAQDPRVQLVEQDALIQFNSIPSCYDHTTSNFPKANSYDPVSPQIIQCWDPQLSCAD